MLAGTGNLYEIIDSSLDKEELCKVVIILYCRNESVGNHKNIGTIYSIFGILAGLF